QQALERDVDDALGLRLVVDERRGWFRQVGHERHHREVADRRVERLAGPESVEPADRYSDLLRHLALGAFPRRLAVPDASTGQGDLARVVSEIGPPAHERHLPGPVGPVQDEGHRGLPGAPPELTPGRVRAEQAFDLIEEVSQRALW